MIKTLILVEGSLLRDQVILFAKRFQAGIKPQSTDYLNQSWYALKDGVEKLRLNLIAKVQEQCMATKATKYERKSMKVLEDEYFAKMEKEKEELVKALTHKLKAKTNCKGKTNKNTVVDA